ncbi:MAG: hypothetical protein JWN70_4871, partial [Planctomycetaceae bacterium]|nr:hypothetical protein [Planctomycetaceae bacterium]
LYSTNGVTISLMENFHHTNLIPPVGPFLTACLASLLVAFLVTACIGWQTRVSLLGAFLIHTYFACNDMATSMTKFTVIETHMLLLLAVSECGRIWSVDSWLAGRRNPDRAPLVERPAWALVPVWPARLLMIMVGATYLGAAITKIHMPDFITGEAIGYWIMSNPNFRAYIGEWMSQYPGLLTMSGHFTVLWEILFIFTAWRGIPRRIMFSLGIFFHFMAAITLGEVIFFFVMGSAYCGCLTESESRFTMSTARRIWSTLLNWLPGQAVLARLLRVTLPVAFGRTAPRLQLAVFTGLMLVAGLGGAWANYSLDLYGLRRPEGRHPLQEVSQDEIARLFVAGEPIREQDKYLGVKVGSLLVSGRLTNQRDQFRYGETIICEASLNPPHEDMFIECHLMDKDKKIINRDGNIAAREARFTQFKYNLNEALEPGGYTLVVRSRGQIICHRDFVLEGGAVAAASSPVAN